MWRTAVVAVFLMVGMCSFVHAQTSSRQLLSEAGKAFKADQYAEALEKYQEAHSRTGDSRILYNIGRCHEELGEVPKAISSFQEFLAGKAPQSMKKKALERLKALQALPTVGSLNLTGDPAGAAVDIDGRPVGVLPLVVGELAPRTYTVRVTAEGFESKDVSTEVIAGEERSVEIALVRIPVVGENPEGGSEKADVQTGSRFEELAWGLVGSGGGLAILGVALGLLGDDYHQTVEESIQDGGTSTLTEAEAKDLRDEGDAFKTTGYALIGVGGAAIVGGIVLFFLDDSDAGSTTFYGGAPIDGGFVWTYGGRF